MLSKFIFKSILGWTLEGDFPKCDQMVIIVIPHTHWVDFIVAILVRDFLKEPIHFLGKEELFTGFKGRFFRAAGGYPVNRSKSTNTVTQAVSYFKKNRVFRLALAPEGTRKKVKTLKTGFYQIAKQAGVPILPVAFDFENKKMIFHPLFFPSPSQESDIYQIEQMFRGIKGKRPERSFQPS